MADNNERKSFKVEGARLIFRNFEGREGQYNLPGDRNFGCVLDEEAAEAMIADGWNVKFLQAREEGDPDTPWIPVTVKFDKYPPRVVMMTETSRTQLDEDTVSTLDWADIKNVDLIVNGSDWSANGKTGTKAYLKTMFVLIEEDDLEKKYAIHDDPPQRIDSGDPFE